MEYKFYMRDPKVTNLWTEIEEPDGWDSLGLTVQRSDSYTGFVNVYSDTIVFVGNSAIYLQGIYDLYLFDALIDFKWELLCEGVVSETYIGAINMITYSEINNEISVKIEESSFSRKILNRLDTVVNFSDERSIEGTELGVITAFELPMHSKAIHLKGRFILNEALAEQQINNVNDESFSAIYLPTQIETDEFNTLRESQIIFDINTTSSATFWAFTAPHDGDYTFDIDLEGTLKESSSVPRSFDFTITFAVSYGFSINLITPTGHSQNGGIITIPYSVHGTQTVPLVKGASVVIRLIMFKSSPPRDASINNTVTELSIKIDSNSFYDTSLSDSYKIYEVLNRVAESITDRPDAIRSEFFGRTDSAPHSYSQNGCGAWLSLLSGKMLRNFINPDLSKANLSLSFKDVYEALDAEYSIGMGVEIINGVEYLRIEPKEYFYNFETVKQYPFVADIKKSFSTKDIYNNFEVGYEKWQLEEVNGIDEINTMHQYSIPITTGSNKLSKVSKFIAGGYAIEYTRRQQFAAVPTTDWRYDDDIFFIALSRQPQTFANVNVDYYKKPGVAYPYTYQPGTAPERDEAFTVVNNYLLPNTGYNIRLSPARMALNWNPILRTSLTQDETKDVKFQSGTGNVFESDQLIDACSPTSELITQNMDIPVDIFEVYKKDAFFKPVIHEFEYVGNVTDFNYLRANSNKSIEFSCSDSNFIKGFIKELNFEPNGEDGGIINFKILESGGCTLGAFDDSFDDSFDIGTC